jgi:hypothetical protein
MGEMIAIEIAEFRVHSKNTLQGFVTVRLTNIGLEIRDLALHEKNGDRWFQLPAKPYEKPDGSKGWNYIVSFYQKSTYRQFQEVALKALDSFQREARRNGNEKQADLL